MYLKYYGLNNRPFQINTDSTMLWLGEKHREALATLKYGVSENKGFLLLTGDIGTGKTTLINALIGNMGNDVIYATVSNPVMEKLDFLNYIANAFNIKRKFNSKGDFIIFFSHFLHKAREYKKRVLLIVDESQKLTQELLDEIRLLSNIEIQNSKLINIFFIGQNEFNDILTKNENAALKQRITLNYNLKPLTKQETYQYIQYRLTICGAKNNIFKKDAIEEVFNFSQGVPRKINILCDHALLTGYVKGKKKIDKSIIQECIGEIEIKVPAQAVDQVQPNRIHTTQRRYYAKAAMYLAAFTILWSIIGFYYYSNNGYSFDNVEKYWKINLDRIKSKLFNKATNENNRINMVDISKSEAAKKKTGDDLTLLAKISQNDSDKNITDTAQNVHIENNQLETDLQNRLKRLDETVAGNESLTDPIIAERTNIATLSTANELPDSMAEIKDPLVLTKNDSDVENTIGIHHDYSDQYDASREQIKKNHSFDFNENGIIGDDAKEVQKTRYAIYFDYNSDLLSREAKKIAGEIMEILKSRPDATLLVKGHTDNAGNHESNIILSQKRANIVRDYLLRKGIDYNRIEILALGDSEPIASNNNVAGRRMNRRVEIEILYNG